MLKHARSAYLRAKDDVANATSAEVNSKTYTKTKGSSNRNWNVIWLAEKYVQNFVFIVNLRSPKLLGPTTCFTQQFNSNTCSFFKEIQNS